MSRPMPQAMPQMMPQGMPQQMMQQPMMQQSMMQQPMMQHPMMQQPMPQAMPQAAPQPMPQAAPQAFQQQQQQIPALPQPTIRAYTPEGGEQLQITIMGTKDVPGAQQPTVHIQVAGKHDFQVVTQAITGLCLQPRTTVTYIQPGDSLIISVKEGGRVLGEAQLASQDFYGGFEGDIPMAGGALAVKITPLNLTGGQVQQLPPVTVQQQRQPVQVSAPIVVGSGGLSYCSPEEFQHHQAQPGAAPVQVMTPEEMQNSGMQVMGVAQPVMQGVR